MSEPFPVERRTVFASGIGDRPVARSILSKEQMVAGQAAVIGKTELVGCGPAESDFRPRGDRSGFSRLGVRMVISAICHSVYVKL